MEDSRQPVIDAASRLTRLLADPQPGLATWHLLYQDTFQELVMAAAEESYIVKAARVLIRSNLDLLEDQDLPARLQEDLEHLLYEVAAAGASPYEKGTGSDTEDSWVEPLRAELRLRNQ